MAAIQARAAVPSDAKRPCLWRHCRQICMNKGNTDYGPVQQSGCSLVQQPGCSQESLCLSALRQFPPDHQPCSLKEALASPVLQVCPAKQGHDWANHRPLHAPFVYLWCPCRIQYRIQGGLSYARWTQLCRVLLQPRDAKRALRVPVAQGTLPFSGFESPFLQGTLHLAPYHPSG